MKDKKESDSIKEQILEINLRIAEIDEELVENAIKSLEEVVMSKKGLKKLNKASNSLEKGTEFLDNEKYLKAIKNFEKAWNQIKKALKNPHFKKLKIIELEGVDDMNFDGIPDVYLKMVEPGIKQAKEITHENYWRMC